jgi:predicted nucleotidyltransferase
MRPSAALSTHRTEVLELAAARGASRVRVFGSTARWEDRDDSDLDLLVDLPAGTSLLTVVALQQDIADTLGVPVDLLTERELDPDLASQIIAQARPL